MAESDDSGEAGVVPPNLADDPDGPAPTSESGAAREDVTAQAPARPSPSQSTESAAVPEAASAPAAGGRRTSQPQPATTEVGAAARRGAKPKYLARELAKAKLPGEVATHLKKLIGAGDIVDKDGLARHGNKRTAEWVVENRVGRWYVEALKDKGVKRAATRDGTVSVPSSILDDVARSIADSPALKKYPDIKVQARDLIALRVKQEVD